MAITSITQTRLGGIIFVTVVSDLTPPPVFLHWYIDGDFIEQTIATTRAFVLDPGEQLRLDVLDSLDPDFDAIGNAPVGFPSRRTILFVRSLDTDVDHYDVEQKIVGATYSRIEAVAPDPPSQWLMSAQTPVLDDLTSYQWRVRPVDQAGNIGTLVELPAEKIVHTPKAPAFTVSFDPSTLRVTFTETT